MEGIYTVSALTSCLRKTLEEHFPFIWVRGEVSGVSRAQSGHIYFTLKDARAQLQCVWFARLQPRGGQKFDPLTGEVYANPQPGAMEMARNGSELLCAGRLDVYAARGQYQLLVEIAQPAGAGLLALEFEARKARLAQLGYFARERKRPLPLHPARIALVTSSRGAAIHDFLEIARNRGLSSRIRLFSCQVQGTGAAEQMAAAIELANTQGWADVIVLIRGGGSMEDLWAFNEECLAKAIFESRLPVLAGIGHEIDYTLADMTADVRAATPTHAAQLLWLPRSELWQNLDNLQLALNRRMEARLDSLQKTFESRMTSLRHLSPERKLERLDERLDHMFAFLANRMATRLEFEEKRLAFKTASLRHLSPAACLAAQENRLDAAAKKLESLEKEKLEKALSRLAELSDTLGKASCLKFRISQAETALAVFAAGLRASLQAILAAKAFALGNLEARLASLDPDAPIKRGYALLYGANGVIKNAAQTAPGETVRARLRDGCLLMNVKAHYVNTSKSIQDCRQNEESLPAQ